MAAYLIKTILCQAVFLAFYYFFLEREKINRFKRFYLLATLIGSMLIPLFTIHYGTYTSIGANIFTAENFNINDKILQQKSAVNWKMILGIIYGLVAFGFLQKFIFNVKMIFNKIKNQEKIPYGKFQILLTDAGEQPHSFWKYIFISKKDFENKSAAEKILAHETAHLSQKHSLDLLLLEILKIIFWFDPMIYFYQKTILTNHEFLADEEALKHYDTKSYSLVLLAGISGKNLALNNYLNFNNTKKRFKMMTTKTTTRSKIAAWLALPTAAAALFLFSAKMPAQNSAIIKAKTAPNAQNPTQPEFPGGMTAFRKKITEKFDTSKLIGKSGLLKSEAKITIGTDGKVLNINVDGNDATFNAEALRTVTEVANSETWNPGTENGKPANSVMRLPMTMNFQP